MACGMHYFIKQNAWYHDSSSLWLLICWESHFKLPLAGMFLRSTVKIRRCCGLAVDFEQRAGKTQIPIAKSELDSWCSHQIGHWIMWSSPWSPRSIDDLCGNIVKENLNHCQSCWQRRGEVDEMSNLAQGLCINWVYVWLWFSNTAWKKTRFKFVHGMLHAC